MAKRREKVEPPEGRSPADAAEIYRQHFQRIFAFVYGRLEDRDEALEVAQEVFFRLLKGGRGTALPDDEVIRYLYGIARNVVADFLAGRISRRAVPIGDEGWIPEPSREARLDVRLVEQCLARLDERDRAILVRHFYRGDTHREIAASLGMTHGNVRQRFHRALKRLRKWLDEAKL